MASFRALISKYTAQEMLNIAPIRLEDQIAVQKTYLKKRGDNKLRFGRLGKKLMRMKRGKEGGFYGVAKAVTNWKEDIIHRGIFESEKVTF